MREPLKIILLISIIGVFTFGMIYFIKKDEETCDTSVIMKDDRIYECAETHTNDGLTCIIGCDGNRIQVPTVDIRTIEKIEER